ncbi:nucleic acid-binding, OB-fold protein [Tanacetum coccineum]
MRTKTELTLEQTQQGVSDEVLVSIEGVEELKRKVKIKGEKNEALLTLSEKNDKEKRQYINLSQKQLHFQIQLSISKLTSSQEFLFEDEVSLSQAAVHADYSQAKEGTLENLLIWARNRKNDSSTFKCRVKIDGIRSRKGWNFLGCGGEKCKKGVVRKDGSFWCQACEKAVDYPVLR